MRVDLVLTIIGPDRPGLVELVSRTVSNHEGNWEASRMARMAGRFAGILQVSVPEEQAAALSAALGALDAQGLRVVVERGPAPAAPGPGATRRLKVELVGHDRPGVIRDVSAALAERGVNVEELATACDSAPMSGGALLRVSFAVSAPADLAPDALRALVEARAPDFMVDVGLLSDPAAAS
ncbi:MAG TPA: ACT domain-containing protein [Kofleriaceae bacterium]|nr:ACT domain-containing protein [Kofleriaceae bacterium]